VGICRWFDADQTVIKKLSVGVGVRTVFRNIEFLGCGAPAQVGDGGGFVGRRLRLNQVGNGDGGDNPDNPDCDIEGLLIQPKTWDDRSSSQV